MEDVATVRRLVGKDKIVGVSVNNIEEALEAMKIEDGADYLGKPLHLLGSFASGIGAIYDTSTKRLTAPLCGIRGLREILRSVAFGSRPVKTVAIGGLNASNVGRVRYQSSIRETRTFIDGVAVVSALMSAENPRETASQLKQTFLETPIFITQPTWKPTKTLKATDLRSEITKILTTVQKETPLVHHLTNNVLLLLI
jgi:thiamine-phosphate diphosphorylase/hydroxyethylthiazole kinase